MTASPNGIVYTEDYVGLDRRDVSRPEGTISFDKACMLGCVALHDEPKVQDAVREEAYELLLSSYDIKVLPVADPHAAHPIDRTEMDRRAEELASRPDGAEIFRSWPAMRTWVPLTTRAIALHPLYKASELTTLGEGIDPAVFGRRIIVDAETGRKQSAFEMVAERYGVAKATEELELYEAFIAQPIDPDSRLVYQGSRDGEGIRSRAVIATALAREHFAGRRANYGIRAASLACGAAAPAFRLLNDLEKDGHTVDHMDLLDLDPMALAAAHSLGEAEGITHKLTLTRKNLLRGELTDVLPTSSIDMVDMLGVIEYMPENERIQMATKLLQRAHQITADGGLILIGNMVADRDQQKFFDDVVQWPKLHQRTMRQTLGIIRAAGLDADATKVRLSSTDGVYAVYAIPVSKKPTLRLVK